MSTRLRVTAAAAKSSSHAHGSDGRCSVGAVRQVADEHGGPAGIQPHHARSRGVPRRRAEPQRLAELKVIGPQLDLLLHGRNAVREHRSDMPLQRFLFLGCGASARPVGRNDGSRFRNQVTTFGHVGTQASSSRMVFQPTWSNASVDDDVTDAGSTAIQTGRKSMRSVRHREPRTGCRASAVSTFTVSPSPSTTPDLQCDAPALAVPEVGVVARSPPGRRPLRDTGKAAVTSSVT